MNEEFKVFSPEEKSVNLVIVIITTAAFFVMQLWEKSLTPGNFYGHTTEFLLEHGALYTPALRDGEWYRLITHMFLHGDITHLMHNMMILFCLGNALEHYLGKVKYVVLYFFGGILAAFGSVMYNISDTVSVGASGAVFAVVGAMAWLVLKNKGRLKGFTGERLVIFIFLSVFAGIGDYNVDNAAHVAGLIAGFFLSMLLYRKPKEEESKL